ncbi:hypothetical protein NIES2100_04860 [Calothrix sp. NIES-2100]|uniref:hypothetical protein n=1 Tax=Calothrix sp. NIES-2100 TaxID=1954172 RepID=UPI000B5E0371|nr:hypothetical protein NIES2100_04860 [Calothrix sp. NIES-2100]
MGIGNSKMKFNSQKQELFIDDHHILIHDDYCEIYDEDYDTCIIFQTTDLSLIKQIVNAMYNEYHNGLKVGTENMKRQFRKLLDL